MHLIKRIKTKKGIELKLISIKNSNGIEVKLLNYGACIVELLVPDKHGNIENIVLTHDDLEDYINNPSYFGAVVGRTSGRIENGTFYLDDKKYDLNKNYEANHGHGGPRGFSFQTWNFNIIEEEERTKVEFSYLSKDIEENYPGNLWVKVIYTLTEENELIIEYMAHSDEKTLCNLTNHSYFNLSGNYKRKVIEQHLKINSNSFLELNQNCIPTGNFIDVENTPMNFNEFKLIGKDLESEYNQLVLTKGYDHTWMLECENNHIEMYDELSGRRLIINTTYPSVVIYSYNFPNNEKLKNRKIGAKYDGICFETQYEPNGINNRLFNSAILNPDEEYYEKTQYRFVTN